MSDDPFELASAGDLLTASTIQPDDDNPLTDVQLFQVSYTYLRKHFIFGHCCNYLLIVYSVTLGTADYRFGKSQIAVRSTQCRRFALL